MNKFNFIDRLLKPHPFRTTWPMSVRMATFLLRERLRTRECSRSRIQRRRLGRGNATVKLRKAGNERRTQLNDTGMKCPVQRMATISLSGPDTAFKSLIAPRTAEEFFECYWEKQPLLIRRNGASAFVHDYHRLFSLGDLRKLVKQKSIRFGKHINVCRYIRGRRENLNKKGEVTDRQFQHLWRLKKATFQMHQPQHFKTVLWQLLAHLESYFSCLVGANVYITPASSQGLAPHYDDVEVFILQLEGRKHWRLYAPPTSLPQEYSCDLNPDDIGEPTHDFILEAGDLLYFPRGTIHQADTPAGVCHSTHITISTYQHHAWGNFCSHVFGCALEACMAVDVDFRRGLPCNMLHLPGGHVGSVMSGQPSQNVEQEVKALLDAVLGRVDIQMAIQSYSTDFITSRLPPPDSTGNCRGPMPTITDSVFMFWPDHTYLHSSSQHVLVYHSLNNSRMSHMVAMERPPSAPPQPQGLKFPSSYKPALELLMKTGTEGLPLSSLPLSEEDQRSLAVSLWAEGLLEVVDSEEEEEVEVT